MGGGQLFRQVLSVVTNVLLARLLSPEDFGLFALAFVVILVGESISSFGLGSAIIQRGERSEKVLSTAFWVSLIIGLTVGSLVIAVAPFFAKFYENSNIEVLIYPLALNLVLSSSLVIPHTLLSQNLNFKDITTAQVIGSIFSSIVALTMAFSGAEVWALVAQPVAGTFCTGLLYFYYSKWLPIFRMKYSDVEDLIQFSFNLFVGGIISTIGKNLHSFILGKKFDVASLGLYNMASTMTGIIIFQVSSVFVKVLFPALSAIKDDIARFQGMWLKTSSIIAFISFPAMAGMFAVAPDLVPVVFGEQWVDATVLLQISCMNVAIHSVLTTSGTVLMAKGKSGILLLVNSISAPAAGLALWLGSDFGLEAAAVCYITVNISVNAITCAFACKEIQLGLWKYLRELLPWVVCAVAMSVSVVSVRELLMEFAPELRLFFCVLAGMALYGLMLVVIARQKTGSMIQEIYLVLRKS